MVQALQAALAVAYQEVSKAAREALNKAGVHTEPLVESRPSKERDESAAVPTKAMVTVARNEESDDKCGDGNFPDTSLAPTVDEILEFWGHNHREVRDTRAFERMARYGDRELAGKLLWRLTAVAYSSPVRLQHGWPYDDFRHLDTGAEEVFRFLAKFDHDRALDVAIALSVARREIYLVPMMDIFHREQLLQRMFDALSDRRLRLNAHCFWSWFLREK